MYVLQYFFSMDKTDFPGFGSDLSYDQPVHFCNPQRYISLDLTAGPGVNTAVKADNFHCLPLFIMYPVLLDDIMPVWFALLITEFYCIFFMLLVYKVIECLVF